MAIFLLIFLVLLLLYSLLIDFYRRSWNSIKQQVVEDVESVKLSVIVPVRNEEHNIEGVLSVLLSQQYPKEFYEVIIIDDHSTDSTYQKLSTYAERVKVIQLPAEISSKKKAIEYGIRAATGDLIVTTDADCRMGVYWLKCFASFYKATGAQFIAAPVKMEGKNSVLNVFQSLDFLAMQAITGASVSKQFHAMCNGANIAYTRKAFAEVNGFEGIDQIPSGDDMLLMHKISAAFPGKAVYMKNRDSIVTTSPETTWKKFIHQRIRWASKAVHYKDKKIFYVLLLTYVVNVCYLALGIAAFFDLRWLAMFGLLLFAKILIEFPFINAAALFFGQQKLMKFFPVLQPLHIVYVIVAGWLGRFGSYRWKDRTIKNKETGNLVKQ